MDTFRGMHELDRQYYRTSVRSCDVPTFYDSTISGVRCRLSDVVRLSDVGANALRVYCNLCYLCLTKFTVSVYYKKNIHIHTNNKFDISYDLYLRYILFRDIIMKLVDYANCFIVSYSIFVT